MTRTFYFNTGVKLENRGHLANGQVWRGGTLQIPFDCDDVPKNASFQFACDHTPENHDHLFRAEMKNTTMVSKYAFFQLTR